MDTWCDCKKPVISKATFGDETGDYRVCDKCDKPIKENKIKFRVGIVTKNKQTLSNNFNTKEEVDDFVLEIAERFGVKHYKVIDRQTKELIEKGKDL